MKYVNFIIVIVNFITIIVKFINMIVSFMNIIVNFTFANVMFIMKIMLFTVLIVNFITGIYRTYYQLVKGNDKLVYIIMVKFILKIVSLVNSHDFDCKTKKFIIKSFVVYCWSRIQEIKVREI